MPGILPTRLTTIRSRLLPVRTFTALLMVMLSKLTPFTSTSLSPTARPAWAADTGGAQRDGKCHEEMEDHSTTITPIPTMEAKQAGKWASYHGDKLWLTCGAVVLHLADKYAESVFRAPADAETQTAIWTFVNSHRVDVFTVVSSCKTKHTWSVLFQSFNVGLRNVLFYITWSTIESMNRKKCKTFD